MTVYNLSTTRASKLPYKCCNFVGRHGETRQSLILFLLSMVTWCCLLVSHCTNICFIFIRGLLPYSPESADKNIKKNNVNSNWTTIDLTDCNLLYQENQQFPHIPHHILQELIQPIFDAGAGVLTNKLLDVHTTASTSVIPGELQDIVSILGIPSTWVPCSPFLPFVCMFYSTPTHCTNGDSTRGTLINPCSCLSPAGAGISDPTGYPTSPPTGPPTTPPTSPPTGPPTQEPTSPPTGSPSYTNPSPTSTKRNSRRKCASKESKRRRRRQKLMRTIMATSVRSVSQCNICVVIPYSMLADRLRPRLLGGALQRHTHTIRIFFY